MESQRIIDEAALRLDRISQESSCSTVGHAGLKKQTGRLLYLLRCAMFPTVYPPEEACSTTAEVLLQASVLLRIMLSAVLDNKEDAHQLTNAYIASLPAISELLRTDIRAAYEGDPAARSEEEVMLAYPAFEAISIFRLAHQLYEMGIPLIPRTMTEYAHRITGIDIHPGAHIGPYFFIDHGTGVVIGETCTIGEHVKLYQGVTLGAKNFEVDEDGNPIKGIKRHPDVGNHVVIYAGATILGGSTVIGDNCTIGGNVWLTHSVEAGQTIYNQSRS